MPGGTASDTLTRVSVGSAKRRAVPLQTASYCHASASQQPSPLRRRNAVQSAEPGRRREARRCRGQQQDSEYIRDCCRERRWFCRRRLSTHYMLFLSSLLEIEYASHCWPLVFIRIFLHFSSISHAITPITAFFRHWPLLFNNGFVFITLIR
jgi:hypothetical protein